MKKIKRVYSTIKEEYDSGLDGCRGTMLGLAVGVVLWGIIIAAILVF